MPCELWLHYCNEKYAPRTYVGRGGRHLESAQSGHCHVTNFDTLIGRRPQHGFRITTRYPASPPSGGVASYMVKTFPGL